MTVDSAIWAVVTGTGSLVIAAAVGALGYFLKRYIQHQDKKNEAFFGAIDRLEETVGQIKTIIEKQDLICENRMSKVTNTVAVHEKRIGTVETVVKKHIHNHKRKEEQK